MLRRKLKIKTYNLRPKVNIYFNAGIYSQYATAIMLKDGKKNANDMCPNCG